MVSTPSRSSASMRISLPSLVRPISARAGEAGAGLVFFLAVGFFFCVLCLGRGAGGGKKPPRVSRGGGFFKSFLKLQKAAPRGSLATTTRRRICGLLFIMGG